MAGLLNLGEMSALALHVMTRLATTAAEDPGCRVSVGEMAGELEASPHTLHKVVTRLVAAGLVESARGPGGGLRLTPGSENTDVLKIVEVVEGRADSNGCLFAKRVCPVGAPCVFHNLTCQLEGRIRKEFAGTTVAQLAAKPEMSERNGLPAPS